MFSYHRACWCHKKRYKPGVISWGICRCSDNFASSLHSGRRLNLKALRIIYKLIAKYRDWISSNFCKKKIKVLTVLSSVWSGFQSRTYILSQWPFSVPPQCTVRYPTHQGTPGIIGHGLPSTRCYLESQVLPSSKNSQAHKFWNQLYHYRRCQLILLSLTKFYVWWWMQAWYRCSYTPVLVTMGISHKVAKFSTRWIFFTIKCKLGK